MRFILHCTVRGGSNCKLVIFCTPVENSHSCAFVLPVSLVRVSAHIEKSHRVFMKVRKLFPFGRFQESELVLSASGCSSPTSIMRVESLGFFVSVARRNHDAAVFFKPLTYWC
ncbi:unnamed protein product, partial [Scytosiphon promiscuus]